MTRAGDDAVGTPTRRRAIVPACTMLPGVFGRALAATQHISGTE
jgi:hypothetical protein